MVIFLSAGMLPAFTGELLAGGYPPETPAAIVYKATWPEEKIIRCDLKDLERLAGEEGITKTALIVVGDAAAQTGYLRSRLYAPEFETEIQESLIRRGRR